MGVTVKRVATISPAHCMARGGDGDDGGFDIQSPPYCSLLLGKSGFGSVTFLSLFALR